MKARCNLSRKSSWYIQSYSPSVSSHTSEMEYEKRLFLCLIRVCWKAKIQSQKNGACDSWPNADRKYRDVLIFFHILNVIRHGTSLLPPYHSRSPK
jgi:hypothetical protein